MGLTVHFKFLAPPDTDAVRAHELVRALRRRAQDFKRRGRVDDVRPIGGDPKSLRWALQYREVPHPTKAGCESGIEIPAEAGFIFPVIVGKGCEPLWLGLCRYPKTVVMGGRRYRTNRPGWRFAGFSKTQYASLHGWEHFLRCHTAVVDLLSGAQQPGLAVTITDEGDYWPRRSLTALHAELDQMNAVVAAAAGALKDCYESHPDGHPVQSPIFAHQHFEQLEAEGSSRVAPVLEKLRAAIGKS